MLRRFGGGFVLLRPDALEAETTSIRHGLFYRMGMPLERIEQDEREAELEIEVLEPGSAAGTRRIVRDELVIGQEPYCKLRLLDRLVSRRHCRIHRTAGSRFWVVDLDSDTGTFVDGKRVCRKLLHGDELIQVGDTQLRVRVLHERDNERDSDALDIPQTHAAVG
jgi:pSer/pThr/pTyr-binding forkhead associated (FHA) protein